MKKLRAMALMLILALTVTAFSFNDVWKVKVGMTKAEVERILGKPKSISQRAQGAGGDEGWYWEDNGLFRKKMVTIVFTGDRVTAVPPQGKVISETEWNANAAKAEKDLEEKAQERVKTNPEECGPKPTNCVEIVKRLIEDRFYDPDSVKALEILEPEPSANVPLPYPSRNKTNCWMVIFRANAKNQYGGYTGRKAHVIFIRDGKIVNYND